MFKALEPIILGAIQGIAEWLPISSSGNLILIMVGILKKAPALAIQYTYFLHIGTLLAAMFYFRRNILNILKNLKNYKPNFKTRENGLISFLIVSTFVTGIVGFPIYKILINFRGGFIIGVIGAGLIFIGLLQKFAHKRAVTEEKNLNLKDAIILGIAQGFAVIPGISRSGMTISTFLLRKYKNEQALKLAFIMSIPVVFLGEIALEGIPHISGVEMILGLISSFVFGIFTIGILMKIAQKIKFWIFCIVIGLIAILSSIIGLL